VRLVHRLTKWRCGRAALRGSQWIRGHLTHYLSEKLTVIVLTNRESASADIAARTLSAIALDDPYDEPAYPTPVSVNPETLLSYAGKYEIRPGVEITVSAQGERLFVQASGQPSKCFTCHV
jgi:hypothetical protein